MALASSKKQVKNLIKKSKVSFRVDNNMPDFSKDPAFIAKQEKAEKLLAECGLINTEPNTKNRKKVKR
jgi:hypothetical protein